MIATSETRRYDERLLANYPDYQAAERAIDLLADRGFPVQAVRVEGRDVRIVEQVTGRMTPWRAAGAGALSGMWFGALIGLIFGIATPFFFAPLMWGLLLGAIFGAIFGGVAQAMRSGRRDFSSFQALRAASWDLWVAGYAYDQATVILTQAGDLRATDQMPAA
jgi:hypothetical protein